MSNTNNTRALPKVWRWEEGYGAEGDRDADKREIIRGWLWDAEGLDLDSLTPETIARLESKMYFLTLRSVVKADHHFLDPDECGGFHSEASGRRTKPAWFIESLDLLGAIYGVDERAAASGETT